MELNQTEKRIAKAWGSLASHNKHVLGARVVNLSLYSHTKTLTAFKGDKLVVSIEISATVRGRLITWVFDGEDEDSAVKKARADVRKKGLHFLDYILVG